MAKYSECPNCGHRPGSDFVIDSQWMTIYRCDECETEFCHDCAEGESCPNCGNSGRSPVGECYGK